MSQKRKKNSDILDMIFGDDSDTTPQEEPKKAPEKPKKRRATKKKAKQPIVVNRTERKPDDEIFKPVPIQMVNKDKEIDLSKVDAKKNPHNLQDFCDIFGVEYNGRHRADIPYGILVGLYDDVFNVYLNGEKVGTYKRREVIRQVKNLLEKQMENHNEV